MYLYPLYIIESMMYNRYTYTNVHKNVCTLEHLSFLFVYSIIIKIYFSFNETFKASQKNGIQQYIREDLIVK